MTPEQATVFDTNLLRNTTPREFFGSLQEQAGKYLWILPAVYRKLEIQIPKETNRVWRRRLDSASKIQRDDPRYSAILHATVKASLAWLRNIHNDERSILKRVDPENTYEGHVPEMAEHIPDNCFKHFGGREQSDNDRYIIAETILYNSQMIATNNLRNINHQTVNDWALNTFPERTEPLIVTGDKATEYLAPSAGLSGAHWLYRGFLGIALPDDMTNATSVIENYLERLTRDVMLPNTTQRISEAMFLDPAPLDTFEYIRANRPKKTRHTEKSLYQSTLNAAENEGCDLEL